MNLRTPISSVLPGAQGVVLGVLASTGEPLTGNRVAELSGGKVSQSSVSRVLRELVRAGIVIGQPAGRANLYSLNLDHVAVPAVLQLATLRQTLLDRIGVAVAAWEVAPVAVWLFGSAARGTGTPDSDIDLFLLRPDTVDDSGTWLAQTGDLADAIGRWAGNACDFLEYSESEFAQLVENAEPITVALRNEAIVICGANPRDRIGRVPR